ncbi:class I SAM-dependent methyltransferase [Salinirubellus salinus]|uniref:Class I SAM-dependent methyltransferase n=1 Tax=Salinirubellus salinus TaxID=1364945 RepID=A0A9E7UC99_9EURY|nr:class I SAM-dependent methyltransferase [Salinirubellus salinus]UWM56058.1 class I SAM-dependent methyltransferase [Salinirubellus salinus]
MTEVLSDSERRKIDDGDDGSFYDQPRYVQHVDDGFRERLTDLYATELQPGDRVLDLMGSWVSHLPDFELAVVGHGLNREELAANERYDEWFVRNLNEDQSLPFEDGSFDAVVCAVSVQYLQYPGRVFAELARVLRPDGVVVVSFSNRMFFQKAVAAWLNREMEGRADLIRSYLDATGAFGPVRVVHETPQSDPFYAVVARRL